MKERLTTETARKIKKGDFVKFSKQDGFSDEGVCYDISGEKRDEGILHFVREDRTQFGLGIGNWLENEVVDFEILD